MARKRKRWESRRDAAGEGHEKELPLLTTRCSKHTLEMNRCFVKCGGGAWKVSTQGGGLLVGSNRGGGSYSSQTLSGERAQSKGQLGKKEMMRPLLFRFQEG